MNSYIFRSTAGVRKPSSKLLSRSKFEVVLTMPRSREYIGKIQKQRMKNREKTSDDEPASIGYLQFLGSGANGAPRSLYFFTDKRRYL